MGAPRRRRYCAAAGRIPEARSFPRAAGGRRAGERRGGGCGGGEEAPGIEPPGGRTRRR